jgi:hypothetical protein
MTGIRKKSCSIVYILMEVFPFLWKGENKCIKTYKIPTLPQVSRQLTFSPEVLLVFVSQSNKIEHVVHR